MRESADRRILGRAFSARRFYNLFGPNEISNRRAAQRDQPSPSPIEAFLGRIVDRRVIEAQTLNSSLREHHQLRKYDNGALTADRAWARVGWASCSECCVSRG